MTPNHSHNPQHRHMMGSSLFDTNGQQQGDHQNNQNLMQMLNMMQAPQFNPYHQHQHSTPPPQRFPYMNAGMPSYSDLMRFQAQQQQQHMGGGSSQQQSLYNQAASLNAQQQGFFQFPHDANAAVSMHLNQINQNATVGLRYPSNASVGTFQQFGQIGGETSMPQLPRHGSHNQYGNYMDQYQSSSFEGSGVQDQMVSERNSPEKSNAGSRGSPARDPTSLESIVNSLTASNTITSMGGNVDLTPLGTILNSSTAGRGRGRGRGRGGGRGRGRGRGGRGGRGRGKKGFFTQADGTVVPIESDYNYIKNKNNVPVYYTGSVSLGLEEDQYWLSELQVYLRSNFAEAFGATKEDIAAPMHGRNKPIALGQVGIRCIHCKNDPPNTRGQQAVSYPSLVSGIYNSVQQMFRLHFDCCSSMPQDVRLRIETLRQSSSSRGGRKQYWIDSAKRLGLVDSPHGIHFGRDPTGPLPPLSGPSAVEMAGGEITSHVSQDEGNNSPQADGSLLNPEYTDEIKRQKDQAYPLVLPEDEDLISDHLYLTLLQMEPCMLMDADRVGCYKARELGFRGLACKWCVGQAGCGRYFPASEASLSQTTTSQTILNHVRSCRRCPTDIRTKLELMKKAKVDETKRLEKPKHGGRKVFFHRLWCRIQGLEIEEIKNVEVKIGRQKGAKNKAPTKKRKTTKNYSSDSDTETEDDEDEGMIKNRQRKRQNLVSLGRKRSIGNFAAEEDESSVDYVSDSGEIQDISCHGCVPLIKPDDTHWLSELQCFIRSDLIEAFSVTAEELDTGIYDDAEELQVGIRCKYCGDLPLEKRPEGHCYFPQSIAAIQSCVSDLHRRHFSNCNQMPEDVRKKFRSIKGFSGKAEGETQQYWIDAAREAGLSNATETAGIRFFRDPTNPTPADELEKAKIRGFNESVYKSLVRPKDVVTSHAILLFRQVRPCRFKISDRRGGPGLRGRDRVIGFPGVACIHCKSGRFFPFTPNSLGGNTYHSLQVHLAQCPRCPEAVKASLAYLVHRSTLEKEELGGGWKKSFFKEVWGRLHVGSAWSSKSARETVLEQESYSSDSDSDNGKEGSDDVEETLDNSMEEMVKAAAQWLTDRDEGRDPNQARRAQRRGLPTGRGLPSRFVQTNFRDEGLNSENT